MTSTIFERLSRFREKAQKPTVSRWLMVLAAVSFGVFTYLAIVNLPPDVGPIDWRASIVAALLVVPVAWLLGLEFKEVASIAGHNVSAYQAFRTAMLASASNLLPIPGAMAVKTGTLIAAGKTVKSSVGSNVIVAILWLAVALLIGASFALFELALLGWMSLGAGLALLAVGTAGLRHSAHATLATLARVVAIETSLTVFAIARIWFVMVAIGVTPSISDSVWLVVVGVLSTVVGIFPAGLGLREAMSAAVAPLIGLDPAVAVLISAVDRAVRLGVLALIGAVVVILSRRASTR